jgi:ankyrin repeat protein
MIVWIVEYLLDMRADPKLKSNSRYTAYRFAKIKNNLAVIDVFKLYEKEK